MMVPNDDAVHCAPGTIQSKGLQRILCITWLGFWCDMHLEWWDIIHTQLCAFLDHVQLNLLLNAKKSIKYN